MVKQFLKIFVLILPLLVGCSAMKQTSIEVLKPARMFVPEDVRKIVLVDNTLGQPAHIGNYIYLIYWKEGQLIKELDGKDTISVDSLGTSLVFNTANTLLETGYYDTVLVWDKNMSDSTKIWTAQHLSGSDIRNIAKQTAADAVYSLDVYTYENALNMKLDPVYGTVTKLFVNVSSRALWRFYDVKNGKTLKHQIVQDSITKEGQLFLPDFGLPSNEDMLMDMAWKTGEASGKVMSPSWKKVNRVYFNKGALEFKLASKNLEQGNFEAFKKGMFPLYEHGKGKVKARAAFNLAFYYELSDQLEESKEWIDKSIMEYSTLNRESVYGDELKIAYTYLNVLSKRLKENKDLSKQLHLE